MTPAAARSRPREGTRRAWRTIRGVRSPRRALRPRQRASDRDAGVRGPAEGAAETLVGWCGPPASADGAPARGRERLPRSLRRSRRRGEPGRESFGRILPRTNRRLARSGPSRSPPGGTRAPAARAAPQACPARPSHAGGKRSTALRSTSLAHRRPGARRTTISGTRARGRSGTSRLGAPSPLPLHPHRAPSCRRTDPCPSGVTAQARPQPSAPLAR